MLVQLRHERHHREADGILHCGPYTFIILDGTQWGKERRELGKFPATGYPRHNRHGPSRVLSLKTVNRMPLRRSVITGRDLAMP
jgi:hypothetical protein